MTRLSNDQLPLTGGNLSGPLILHSDPNQDLQAATKQYVDSITPSGGGPVASGQFLPLSGGTMSGTIYFEDGLAIVGKDALTLAGGPWEQPLGGNFNPSVGPVMHLNSSQVYFKTETSITFEGEQGVKFITSSGISGEKGWEMLSNGYLFPLNNDVVLGGDHGDVTQGKISRINCEHLFLGPSGTITQENSTGRIEITTYTDGAKIELYGNNYGITAPQQALRGQAALRAGDNAGNPAIILNNNLMTVRLADIIFSPSSAEDITIRATASGGLHNKTINIYSGEDEAGGAFLRLGGIDSTSTSGSAFLVCGDHPTASLNLLTPGSQPINLGTNDTVRFSVDDVALFPSTTNVYNVGKSDKHVDTVYTKKIVSSGTTDLEISVEGVSDEIVVGLAGTDYWKFEASTGNLIPLATVDIGSNSSPVNRVYAETVSPFTGTHFFTIKDGERLQIGDCVSLVAEDTVELSKLDNDPSCVGIVCNVETDPKTGKKICQTASVGDAKTDILLGFKVCKNGGDIKAGDLLTTCKEHPGYLKKQEDNYIYNYTVGKAAIDVSFDQQDVVQGVYGFIYCG